MLFIHIIIHANDCCPQKMYVIIHNEGATTNNYNNYNSNNKKKRKNSLWLIHIFGKLNYNSIVDFYCFLFNNISLLLHHLLSFALSLYHTLLDVFCTYNQFQKAHENLYLSCLCSFFELCNNLCWLFLYQPKNNSTTI